MKGVTAPLCGSMITMRELLFCPLCAWVAWFESERSEEHTSEPQSPCNLVCRLLLEKKKTVHHGHLVCLPVPVVLVQTPAACLHCTPDICTQLHRVQNITLAVQLCSPHRSVYHLVMH